MDIKKFFTEYGLFLSFIVVFFIIVFFLCFFAKGAWTKGMEHQLELFLNDAFPEKYQVLDKIPIDSSFSVSMIAFELESTNEKNQKDNSIGIVIKISTLYGPMPAVYEYKSSGIVEFLGFIGFGGKSSKENMIINGLKDSIQLYRWKERIPNLLPISYLDEKKVGSN